MTLVIRLFLLVQSQRSWLKDVAKPNMPTCNRNTCEDYYNENAKMTMMMIVRKMMMYDVIYKQQAVMNVV